MRPTHSPGGQFCFEWSLYWSFAARPGVSRATLFARVSGISDKCSARPAKLFGRAILHGALRYWKLVPTGKESLCRVAAGLPGNPARGDVGQDALIQV